MAIIRFLALKYKSALLPYSTTPEAVAKIDQAVTYINGTLGKPVFTLVSEKAFKALFGGVTNPEAVTKAEIEISAVLTKLSEVFFQESADFVVGTERSLADLALAIILSQSGIVKYDLSAFPKVQNFYTKISATDGFKASHTEFFAFLAQQEFK